MSRSFADYDLARLSPAGRATLEEIAIPSSDGATPQEIAARLGTTPRDVAARLAALSEELEAQRAGATVRELTDAEYEALRDSIAAHGQLVPALVDDSGRIIAGHNRKRVCDELGLELRTIVVDAPPDAARELGLVENFVRRQLTPGDRRRAIAAELTRDPERSDRLIARMLGVSHPTVATVRRELAESGRLEDSSSRKSADGRTRPASQPDREARTERQPSTRIDYITEELRSLAAMEDREHAHARADELLLEAVRLLGGHGVAQAWEQSGDRYYAKGRR